MYSGGRTPRGVWMKVIILLLLITLSASYAVTNETPYYATQQQLERWHNERYPGNEIRTSLQNMTGEMDTIQRGYRMQLRAPLQAAGPDGYWKIIKPGGVKTMTGALDMAKSGGRMIGYGAAFTIGTALAEKAFQSFFDEVKSEASPQNELYTCLSNSNNLGFDLGLTATCGQVETVMSFPSGPLPTAEQSTITWFNFTDSNNLRYSFTVIYDYAYSGGIQYFIQAQCGNLFNWAFNAQNNGVYDDFQAYTNSCVPPRKSAPIDLATYIDGGSVNGQQIPPHPNVKQDIYNAVDRYLERQPLDLSGRAPIVPGVQLVPLPNINQMYGKPLDCSIDTDGDGWGDCEELLRQSDPNNRTSVPNTTRDTDGDGAVDALEDVLQTNPYDPASVPTPEQLGDLDADGIADAIDPDIDGDTVPNEQDPEPRNKAVPVTCTPGYKSTPDGRSCIPDPDQVPKDEESCVGAGGTWADGACSLPEDKTPGLPTIPDLPPDQQPVPPQFDTLKDNFSQNLQNVKLTASDKFPFGIGTKWFAAPAGQVTSECPEFQIDLLEMSGALRPCDTQIARDAHETWRPVIQFVLVLLFAFGAARVVTSA